MGELVGGAIDTPVKVKWLSARPAGVSLAAQGFTNPFGIDIIGLVPREPLGEVSRTMCLDASVRHVPIIAKAL